MKYLRYFEIQELLDDTVYHHKVSFQSVRLIKINNIEQIILNQDKTEMSMKGIENLKTSYRKLSKILDNYQS